MESGERLASPSPASPSFRRASSSTSSSPAPPQTLLNQYSSATESSSPLVCGRSFWRTGDEHSNIFSPAFGLYSPGCSEFGGLGSLGLSAMATHSDLGTFPDWWRPVDAHTREAAAAFFPPLLSLHPLFASTFKSLDSADLQSRTPGLNGALNGRSPFSPTVNTGSFPAKENKAKAESNTGQRRKSIHEKVQLHHKTIQNAKEKPMKRPPELSSGRGSQSGSLSESSSDEEVSSDPDDMEEEDDDGQSSDSEDSDSEKEHPVKRKVERMTQDTYESKRKRCCASDGNASQDSHYHNVPVTSSYHVQSCSRLAGLPQSSALFHQSSRSVEEESQQHISVIQATGLAVSNSPSAQSHRKACPLPFKSSNNHISLHKSSKHLAHLMSPRLTPLLSAKQSSGFSSPKPPALCSPKKPFSRCSSPKQPPLGSPKRLPLSSSLKPPLASNEPSDKASLLMPPGKCSQPLDSMKEISGNLPDKYSLHLKQPLYSKDSVKPDSSVHPKSQSCDTNLFLNLHPNGATRSVVQDAPLALITKPRGQSHAVNTKPLLAATGPPYLMPINLSNGTKEMSNSSVSPHKSSASSTLATRSAMTRRVLHDRKSLTKTNPTHAALDLTRNSESDFLSRKGSDDSLGEDCDDDDNEEDEESGSSLSDSESNLESNSDDSEDDIKECAETEANRTLKASENSFSIHKSSPNLSASYSVLNLQITKPPHLPSSGLLSPINNTKTLDKNPTTSPSFTSAAMPGSVKRKRVTDERALLLPLEFGWQRETRIRALSGRLQGEVAYVAPCGKKLRQYPDVMKYLVRNGITEISRGNFSFSTKIKVGDFYEAREGPEGLQWFMLTQDEIAPTIISMDGRRSRHPKSDHQPTGDAAGDRHPHPENTGDPGVSDAKLLRKLEAQARKAAQIKIMRKLEKQAMAQAAKEARKQQAIIAAEEKRKKREELKILKQQEKIKRIQQIRMEKELRAQQILEVKRKKKEAAAHAKILEAEKRNKEKEMRRLQAVIQKHQELERHRLDMERERRRQHMILMKALDAQKKAEEKERLKREKKDEKRLNKERKLELRRLEQEKAKELKKPNEDMCLADHKPLPELSRIPGLVLAGNTFSDCLMVLQFLRRFGKVLGLHLNSSVLTISTLQEGLLNIGTSMYKVEDLLVSMLSAAVCDPCIPAGHKCKTILGEHLSNLEINRDNVSEILQIYMEGRSEQTHVAALAVSLKTKAFQAHSPSQKASILAYLVNELCCSKAVISEIDKKIDYMTNLRRDKWAVEGELRKLRNIHVKMTGRRDSSDGGNDNHTFGTAGVRNKCKTREGDSDEEEEDEDESDDQGDNNDEEEEESWGKKEKKTVTREEEDDGAHSGSIEELEKQIEKAYKLQSQIRQKLFDSSLSLRSMMVGEDRYRRRYWLLPQSGGIFVEGMASGKGYEEMEQEGERQRTSQAIGVKEPKKETTKPAVSIPVQNTEIYEPSKSQQDEDNLFLQNPDSLSNLSKLLEVVKMAQKSEINAQKTHSAEIPITRSYPSYPTSQKDKTDTSVSSLLNATKLKNSHWTTHSPQSVLHRDQLSKILTENSSEWFSLLPRSPCDGSSATPGCNPPASSSSPQPIRTDLPSFLFPNLPETASYNTIAGINNTKSPIPQHVKSAIDSRLTMCEEFSSVARPSLPLSGSSLPRMLHPPSQHAAGGGNTALCLADSRAIKSETPEPETDKPSCASSPAVEVAKTQDFPCPQPIPQEMLHGWWRVSGREDLDQLVKTLNSRGIRERILQKQIQKHMEHMTQHCADSNNEFDVTELEKQGLSRETVQSWCVEKWAMDVDIALLQQVEALERKVISASLQVKGWMPPEPQSDSKDLVYHEHRLSSAPEKRGQRDASHDDPPGSLVRRSNNPLDIAVIRLAELEENIEQSSEEVVAPGMKMWHRALSRVRSSAQLSLCIQQLKKSIGLERSIMKVHCQLCEEGDNEELLLLCDGCDKGCHTYCLNPKITSVPEGDWFCPFCLAKESDQTPHSQNQESRTAGGEKKGSEVKQNSKPSGAGEPICVEDVGSNSTPKRGSKEFRKRKDDGFQAKCGNSVSCAKKVKTSKNDNNELAECRKLLAELEAHQDAWPFLTPVNLKTVPGYRKVIKKPMDFSTIKEKLTNNLYLNMETFIIDVNLVFDNCQKFNEDDSEIGQAGHNMRRFFDQRWTELLH
ncbi:bromodomain adjacent to zinc finger domain protein 2B isoform X2 [Cololabis saira]|uniref:bromodomain adjacent to zinc finger domain protein 2B isoform X2 n=1 Tax=Cololabis saira TaxID=129043 RepID=UPI002AD488F3|nr:bromodomain adjacent to zinc finger domain protein 2B isoform X2 [Cololabis saira]